MPTHDPWQPAPAADKHADASPFNFQDDEIHLWRVILDQPAQSTRLVDYLSAAERTRAARFYFERDRVRFTVAHAALRLILARYLDRPPLGFDFQTNPYGKPSLAAGSASFDFDLHFNIAHSGSLCLIALDLAGPIGVDVEQIRADFAVESIAERYFSPHEVQAFRALPPALRPQGFFNAWTRKEAYIKAHGLGLSMPLSSFDVTLTPGEPAELIATRPDETQAVNWRLVALETGSMNWPQGRYAGALCHTLCKRHDSPRLRFWQWELPS